MKEELKSIVSNLLQNKIKTTQADLYNLQTSLNEETKSSMGDKYETGRAMIHIEMDKLKTYLLEQESMLAIIDKLDMKVSDSIVHGSLINTSMGWLWLSISLGKINIDNENVIALSPYAPLGKLLLGKKVGDKVSLNNNTIEIFEIN